MARPIDLDQLMKYPLRRGSEHCDEKNADPRFLNGVESILEWAQTLPTFTPPNELLTLDQLREMYRMAAEALRAQVVVDDSLAPRSAFPDVDGYIKYLIGVILNLQVVREHLRALVTELEEADGSI